MKKIFSQKGQVSAEIAVILGVVLLALTVMQTYVSRGIKARAKDLADHFISEEQVGDLSREGASEVQTITTATGSSTSSSAVLSGGGKRFSSQGQAESISVSRNIKTGTSGSQPVISLSSFSAAQASATDSLRGTISDFDTWQQEATDANRERLLELRRIELARIDDKLAEFERITREGLSELKARQLESYLELDGALRNRIAASEKRLGELEEEIMQLEQELRRPGLSPQEYERMARQLEEKRTEQQTLIGQRQSDRAQLQELSPQITDLRENAACRLTQAQTEEKARLEAQRTALLAEIAEIEGAEGAG
jgi:chromosome segregation ATPase